MRRMFLFHKNLFAKLLPSHCFASNTCTMCFHIKLCWICFRRNGGGFPLCFQKSFHHTRIMQVAVCDVFFLSIIPSCRDKMIFLSLDNVSRNYSGLLSLRRKLEFVNKMTGFCNNITGTAIKSRARSLFNPSNHHCFAL